MNAPTLRAALRAGVSFGTLFSIVLISISQLHLILPEESPASFWLSLSWISLSAGAIWGAFLWFNYHFRKMPGRFLYHLFVGLALSFSSALLIGLWSYASVTVLPALFDQFGQTLLPESKLNTSAPLIASSQAGKYALTNYSLVFFIAFVQTLFLSTISCIRECVKQ